MPQLLTRLKITEVSAVDRAAGEGTKIILMKRDDDRPTHKPHVERAARRLRKLQAERDQPRSFNEIMKAMTDHGDELDDPTRPPVAPHHASTAADLLIESGRFPDRTAALDYLLNTTRGTALLQRLHKAADQTTKETNMDKSLQAIAKTHGIVAVAKSIVDENCDYGITEHEFVALATEQAKSQHPDLTDAQGFAKMYEIPEVWRACNVLKTMPFQVSLEPLMVGGEDTRDLSDTSTAIEQLKKLGRDRWPTASESQQFERALIDPVNHKLARRAVPIPQPVTSYPYPY